MNKKVVIIGGGLGGLTTGVILQRNGYDVLILEQGTQIGGCLQCFHRKGVKFETGMHFIGSAYPDQTIGKLMRFLEMDDIKLRELNRECYEIISLDGDRFKYAIGREAFIDGLASYFPNQKDNLVRYYDIIEDIASASSVNSLKHAEGNSMVNLYYQRVSIDSVLEELIDDPLLRNVLVGNLPLYAPKRGATPFSQHAFVMGFYNRSSFRIAGGSDNIAKSLSRTLERHGGEIRLNSRVTKILCDDTQAIGVEVNNELFEKADIIISAAHPTPTMRMIDSRIIRPAFRQRMIDLPNTMGSFSVYLKFKPGSLPYMNSNFYGYRKDTPWDCENYSELSWPEGYLYMHFCEDADQEYARSGVILSYMKYEDVSRWAGTKIGRRGAEYDEFKRLHAEKLIDCVERDFPDIRKHIDCYFTSTPLTYEDYTGTESGSMYGVEKNIHLGLACRVPHKTRIPNLLFTGQNINSHGFLGVMVGAIVTCSELLSSELIYNQIKQANR